MTKNTVIDFARPSDFSPDPLTDVLPTGARELLATAVRAEVSEFIALHADLLDDKGRQRLVRHGFLPEREVLTGIGKVSVQVPRVRDRGGKPGWLEGPVQLVTCAAVSAQSQIRGGVASMAVPEGHLDRRFQRGTGFVGGPRCRRSFCLDDHAVKGDLAGRI